MSSTPYVYLPTFLSGTEADDAFGALRVDLDWIRHDGAPRCEYFASDFTEPYSYGVTEYARTYHPQPWHRTMLDVRSRLEEEVNAAMDLCFLNLYLNQRDFLGWHSDDSPELDSLRPIVSVSLGAVRNIQMRPINGEKTDVETIALAHGSAFIMLPGAQSTHRHRIPKSGSIVGERISLTFRGYQTPQ